MLLSKWKILILSVLALSFLTYFGCTENKFTTLPNPKCEELNNTYGEGTCIKIEGGGYTISQSHETGKTDILFVVDNSGSMFEQQKRMATSFINFYEQIKYLDFRVAVITTDVSYSPDNDRPRAGNGFGEFQDGKFLAFNDEKTKFVLTQEDCAGQNKDSCLTQMFTKAIQRQETLGCDTNNADEYRENCPSGDERGVFAVNLALDSGRDDFFRSDASFHIVFLSDEDERSTGGETIGTIAGKTLEPYDLPQTLVEKVTQLLGPLKLVTVHSIIIPPLQYATNAQERASYQNCHTQQNNEGNSGLKGFYGDIYAQLSHPSDDLKALGNIDKGHIGSICASDYAYAMGQIGSSAEAFKTQLVCQPIAESLDLQIVPSPNRSYNYEITSDNILKISPNPGPRYTMQWTYDCPYNF